MQLQLIFLVIILLIGCNRYSPQENSSKATDDSFLGIYRGVIPCADCQGVAYTLNLQEKGSYTESLLYMGKSDTPFVSKGSWFVENDSVLVLNKKPEMGMNRFLFRGGILLMLNREGKIIEGNTAAQYILRKPQIHKPAEGNASVNQPYEHQQADTDFAASGNEPFWSLKIDFGTQLSFHVLGGDSIHTPVPLPVLDEKSGKVTYEATTEAGKLQVIIQAAACTDNMSGNTSGYTVAVNLNGKNYAGCGRYLFNAERLHDIWALEELNGESVSSGQFSKGVPMLEIYVLAQKVMGHSGCNNISGRAIIEQNKIHFTQLIATKMACPGDMESKFMANLNSTDTYRLQAGKLVLLKDDMALLQFKKVD